MSEPLIFVYLLLAVAIGFLLGRFLQRRSSLAGRGGNKISGLRQSYFEGLNYLLNEQPDAAIDSFVAALDVNSETLETHFALGSLLRRRGEVERAIRVHQNLLARPSLSSHQQQQAQIELALDYMKSGLLDRAEVLFKELIGTDDLAVRVVCLERLVDIYRDEKEWDRAIETAEQLCIRKLARNGSYWRKLQAHFCCELAEQAISQRDWREARHRVKQALCYDRENIRAHLDLAHIEMALGDFGEAARVLKKIPPGSSLYISEALPLIGECFQRLERLDTLHKLLEDLYRQKASELLLQHLAWAKHRLYGDAIARRFVAEQLPHFVTLAPIGDMLNLFEQQVGHQPDYEQIAPIVEKTLAENSAYECQQCGFTGQQLHWCCPTCKSWGNMTARHAGSPS